MLEPHLVQAFHDVRHEIVGHAGEGLIQHDQQLRLGPRALAHQLKDHHLALAAGQARRERAAHSSTNLDVRVVRRVFATYTI